MIVLHASSRVMAMYCWRCISLSTANIPSGKLEVPPVCRIFSRRITFAPPSAAVKAAAIPVAPEPITTMSVFKLLPLSVFICFPPLLHLRIVKIHLPSPLETVSQSDQGREDSEKRNRQAGEKALERNLQTIVF